MKLVYAAPFSSRFPSRDANSIHIMRMCEAFADLNHTVTLFIPARGASEQDILDHYGVQPSFIIRQVSAPGIKGKSLWYSAKVYSAIKHLAVDRVVGRSTQVCALTARKGIPTVYDSHAPIWQESRPERLAYRTMLSAKGLVRMTTNSRALKTMYENANKVPHCGITVASNASRPAPLDELPASWPGDPAKLQAGYIGHLYRGRGMELIVQCAEQLPEVDFHIIGGNEADITFWRSQVDLANVHLHGFVPPRQTHMFRNACDILLAPYRASGVQYAGGGGDQSAYMNPIKLFEYMASRKPIVCSDLPVLGDVLQHKHNAYLCRPDHTEDWVEAIQQLALNKNWRETLAEQAYADFLQHYTWQARAQKMLASDPASAT